MKSPCTGRCGLDKNNVCAGCGRTRENIINWTVYSDATRQRIMDELKTGKEPKK